MILLTTNLLNWKLRDKENLINKQVENLTKQPSRKLNKEN